ncbi:hypothetical protein [Hymenobacter terricola]|uniref:hypothetical protein n=1 Tax=Hymenobacter terricola TaxID=2819236 RepID=UPI001B30541D|nr:hypothetical protein [Hymenobacter terricola]
MFFHPIAIIAGQLLGLVLSYAATGQWINPDRAGFRNFGRPSSPPRSMRQQWRLGYSVSVALVTALPCLAVSFSLFSVASTGLASLGSAYLFYALTADQNRVPARAYARPQSNGAASGALWPWPDRVLARRAIQAFPDVEPTRQLLAARSAHAARELQLLRRLVLGAGAAVYTACLFAAWHLS